MRMVSLANHFNGRYRHLILALDGVTTCRDRLAEAANCRVLDGAVQKRNLLGSYITLRRTLVNLRPDLLVTYNWGAIEWALANLPPLCRHVHIEDGFGREEATRQFRRRILFRRLVLSPRAEVVLPSRVLYHIARDVWHLPDRRLHYLPNGIDCRRFAAPADEPVCATLRRHPDELLVGTVAALRPEKNVGRLIQAFQKVANTLPARLVIVGDGPERPRLEALAAELGLAEAVVFAGALRAPERLLGALDLFALSSDTEQMPITILEAMAAGLAVASVRVGDVCDMLAPPNRSAVVPVAAEALAGAMLDLLQSPDRRAAIGAANAQWVCQHYDQSLMFSRYAALFDNADAGRQDV
jgi:L-malate glycosyltransferase